MYSRVLLCLCLLFGCTKKAEVRSFVGVQMEIPYHILVGDQVPHEQLIQECIAATFQEVNSIYNYWNPESEISRVNRAAAGQSIELSQSLALFLHRCAFFVQLSRGKFDPAILPLYTLWKEHLEQHTVPSNTEIAALRPAVGWHTLSLNGKLLQKSDSRTAFDLGGVAKGYCVDLLTERLTALGVHNLFVEWGGEVRTTGRHPEGRCWNVAITHPESPRYTIATFPLQDSSCATSGTYVQRWQARDLLYTHILDPEKGAPLEVTTLPIQSITVLARDCLTADVVAKILFLTSSKQEAEELAQELIKQQIISGFYLQ